jgi:hypothetical protein
MVDADARAFLAQSQHPAHPTAGTRDDTARFCQEKIFCGSENIRGAESRPRRGKCLYQRTGMHDI